MYVPKQNDCTLESLAIVTGRCAQLAWLECLFDSETVVENGLAYAW